MMASGSMAYEFSNGGKYFAQLTTEGKVKIWNTHSNTFEQEFTPDFHLTAPCTCLHFLSSDARRKSTSPRKKKRRESFSDLNTRIALGTSSGRLLIYSLMKGDLDFVIDSTTSQYINCLSSNKGEFVYSGTDTNILVWNLHKRNVSSKWVIGNEKVTAVLVVPDTDKLLTASKCIKLWSVSSQEVLKTFTGHSSQISILYYIESKGDNADDYVISGSKGDRMLSCWNLNEEVEGKNTVASFLMEDIINNISVNISDDGATHIAATVRSGVVHVYQHILNGKKNNKPVKPKSTIQVISDQSEKEVVPIYITAATYRNAETLCICYGTTAVQTFEDISISTYKKLQCLLRGDPHKKSLSKENQASKFRTPVVGNDVHYLSSQTSSVPTKRKADGQQEIPMEKRLENLMVNDIDNSCKVPRTNNVAQLLTQGLHTKDKNILRTVLIKKDEQLMKNTIQRIPATLIPPLFEELTQLIQGKTTFRHVGLMWLRNLILIHSGLLLSNPDLPQLFSEALGSIEAGLALQAPRNRLMGRLELLVSQISQASPQESQDHEPLLVFKDKGSSDSENDEMEFEDHSNSENEWSSEVEEKENERITESDNELENESDEPMSS